MKALLPLALFSWALFAGEWQMPEELTNEQELKDYIHEAFKQAKKDNEFQFPDLGQLPTTSGQHFNPFTEMCFSCLFPVRVAGVLKVSNFSDALHPFSMLSNGLGEKKPAGFWKNAFCNCNVVGIKSSFWEPAMFVEVTPTPYKILLLGGKDFSNKFSVKIRGGISQGDAGRTSFYHVHYIPFPILRILQVLPGMTCLKNNSDMIPMVPWISEWDPTWRNPKLARLFSLEMYLHNNTISQNLCREDCKEANEGKLNNKDFWWCAGCLGSLYPLVGHVPHHIGGVQSSSLLVYRAIAKLHFFRSILGFGTGFEEDNYCKQTRFRHLQKTFYKTQLAYPITDKSQDQGTGEYCHPLGQGVEGWGSKKTFPYGGEDFSYLVWTKMQCCIDLPDIAKSLIPGKTATIIIETIESMHEFMEAVDKNILENMSKNPDEGTLWK